MPEMSVIDQIATALRDSTIPSDRVSSWMCRWSLMRGQLICTQCQAAQSAEQADERFIHRPGCIAVRGDGYPWQELAELLNRLPQRRRTSVPRQGFIS
ncbi:hypothetical protein [Pseudomonas sp. NA-150]|uniref:hypothetical protein n=1 Tax=Pseudomonas sp. NA-150 TaxID=3367525 RepID=UPI0037C69DB1